MSSLAIIAALKKYKVIPQLEGDKIRLVGETKSLPEELLALVKAEKKELISFLLKAMDQVASSTITPVALQENYPASNAQERLWVLSQFDGGTTAYNIATSMYLSGIVNHELLEKAFQAVIQRHESIRTVFKEVNGELRQIILDEIPFNIIYEDISHYPEMSAFLKEEADRSANWHFDLEKGPLIKVKLFRMSGEEHALIFGIHHIVCDGWSANTLIREVMLVYNAYTRQEKIVETPLRINYKDYTDWLKRKINGSSGDAAKVFWKEQFNPPAEPLHLFTDFPRPPVKSFEGAYASFYLDESRYKGMVAFCREHQITLFNFLRATVNLLLYKYSGQERIVIGTPVSGRNHYDLAEQIGLYVNTLPLMLEIDPEDTLIDFLKKTTGHSLSAFEHQEYPLDKIIDDLQIKRDPGRNPLFDVMMVLQGSAMEESANRNISKEGFALGLLKNYLYSAGRINDEKRGAKFDLSFYFDSEPDNRFVIEIEYALSLFQQSTIHRLFNTYLFIISEVLKAPGKKIRELASVDEAAQEVLLREFNAPVGPIEEHSLAGLLQPSFAANGDKTALITKDSTFSYNTLAEMSDRVAAYLQPGHEAADRQVTGLLMGRSEWMIISMLAILKTGSAYVPIDITYPVGRIEYMLEDAAPACLIVDDAGAGKVPEGYRGRIIHIKELKMLPVSVSAVIPAIDVREHIAYLIYTSGSTGQPKGVTICHRNVMAFLKWALEEFGNTPYQVLYATTSYCFDLSVFEIFLPLLQGKTIRLLESALQIPAWVTSDRQVMINTVPSVVRALLDEDMKWEHVVALNMAGEPLSPKIIHDLQGTQMEIRNLYGPSEGTTYTTVYRFEKGTEQVIPIGKPVKYTQLYILDKYMHTVPIGVEGEIYLGGQLIAKGYLHKPVLTAERFIENPYLPGTQMYKTGDSGRWMPDGNVLFAGRLDDQIKIRGYRIEPGEVQYCLEKHPSVDQAVVTVHTINGEQQLAAYWTSSIDLSTVALKDYLASLLPAYMVPSYFIKLESIPVNSNGKTDKKQLPLPFPEKAAMVIGPENELQQKILDIWAGVLNTTGFGITDNFFELGGHSLKATRLRSLIAMDLQREISLQDIFRYPTIKEQALHLDKKTDGQLLYIPRTATADAYPISFAQERLWVLTKFKDASKAYNMSAAFVIHGRIDIGKFETAFKMVIERHEVLRTTLTTAGNEPVQVVHKPEDLMFAIEKINVGNTLKTGAVYALLQEEWQKPFDLERGPLLRCQLISTPDEQLLSFSMHHIISDGWSVMVLFKDVTTIYRHLVNGLDTALPELSFQYRDFSVWQRQFLTGEQLASQLSYWQEILSGELPVLELPTDHPRPDVKTYAGATWRTRFSPLLTQQIHLLAVNNGVSLFMVLHAAVNVLLKKYTNQQDIITGTPIAGRNGYELEGQIGFYVNTLPIRININGEMSFHSLLSGGTYYADQCL
jgi:amino acid adenylation domain-containing protein